jgi:hypothetical protein
LLLCVGSDPDLGDALGKELLNFADQNGHANVFRLLLEKGAFIDERDRFLKWLYIELLGKGRKWLEQSKVSWKMLYGFFLRKVYALLYRIGMDENRSIV